MTTILVKISAARRSLEQAKSLPEVKDIRDKAEAIRNYAKQAGETLEVQNIAAEIKLRAERKAGRLLAKHSPGSGRPKKKKSPAATFLEEAGVTNSQSSRWQQEARVPDGKFEKYVIEGTAEQKELTSAGLRKLAKEDAAKKPCKPSGEPLPADARVISSLDELGSDTFSTLYIDPPWKYGNQGTRAATSNHYSTMSLDELAALPIENLADENAHLHLWTTNAFIFAAGKLIEQWGFEYKSCFVWVKPQMGIGNYWRVSHEFLLLGVRGKCPFLSHSHISWAEMARGKHSEKPEDVRRAIEAVSPGPYLEMFGRKPASGWTVFGNQVST